VLKIMKTLWKNTLIIVKAVWIIYVNFIVIAITFSEKKIGSTTFILPLYNWHGTNHYSQKTKSVCVCVHTHTHTHTILAKVIFKMNQNVQ
jgi:hypothetical protein